MPIAAPYEANQPAGENWRLGIEMAVAEINESGGILGCQLAVEFQDTQADPDVSKQVVADMAEGDPYVFLGTVFSSNTIVNMVEAQRAEIPMFVGAEAPAVTDREQNGDNDFIYRTSFGVDTAADKFISYIVDQGVTSVDFIYKNDEFGAGGREAYGEAFDEVGIEIQLDIQVQPDQTDLSAEVVPARRRRRRRDLRLHDGDRDGGVPRRGPGAGAGEADVRRRRPQRRLDDRPGAAGRGRRDDHPCRPQRLAPTCSPTGRRPTPSSIPTPIQPDHNSIKGYTAVYIVKEATERIGSFDNSQFSDTLHCATLTVADEPGLLLDVSYDGNGDIDRESYLVEVVDGVGQITETLPPLDNLAERGC